MKKAFYETATGIVVAVGLFASGVALGNIINRLPIAAGDAATWAGALLTGLAFGGTIWIAMSETRRRHRAELLVAQLFSAGMVLRLVHAQSVVADICRRLNEQSMVDRGAEYIVKNAELLQGIDLWKTEDLLPLTALPKIAVRLAESGDQLRSAIQIFLKLKTSKENAEGPERMIFANKFHPLLVKTQESINAAIVDCRSAANDLQRSSFI